MLLRVFQFLVNLDIYYVISCSTLNIFSLVFILKFILIYCEGRKLENCNRLLRLPWIKLFIHSFLYSYSTMSLEVEYRYAKVKYLGFYFKMKTRG